MSGNSWGAKHKTALAVAAAAAATALTAGAASPALAAALGGTAAAEGAGAAGAGLLGAGAGTAAADTAAAGLGGGTAALFGPTAGGSALAAETGAVPFLTGGASGFGGGTASLFGGAGLPAADLGGMYTAGLGSGAGGASMPTFMDSVNSGLSRMLPGGNDTLSALKSGAGKLAKAQQAYKSANGLLSGPPQGGGPLSRPFADL